MSELKGIKSAEEWLKLRPTAWQGSDSQPNHKLEPNWLRKVQRDAYAAGMEEAVKCCHMVDLCAGANTWMSVGIKKCKDAIEAAAAKVRQG